MSQPISSFPEASEDIQFARPRPLRRESRGSGGLIRAFLLIFGGAVGYFGVRGFWHETQLRSWPTAPGQVVEARVTLDSVGIIIRKTTTSIQREDRLHLRYEFVVDGIRYTGTGLGITTRDRVASADRQRYPVGATVTVHYNPSAPSDALVDTSRSFSNIVGMLLAAVMLGSAYRTTLRPRPA